MPEVAFDRYYRHAEIEALFEAYAREFSQLFRFESIGKSHEGRDIFLATLTNRDTGAPERPWKTSLFGVPSSR